MIKNCPVCGSKVNPTPVQLKYGIYRCLPCKRAEAQLWRQENKEHIAEYRREWRKNNLAKVLASNRKCAKKRYHRLKAQGRKYERPFLKSEAKRLAYNAIRRGEIVRSKRCQKCKNPRKLLHAHHHDYSKPLSVIFLCPPCHSLLHRFPIEGKG